MKRVLIVDDDPMILEIAQFSLETAGWTVLTADNGHEAVQVATAELPDAILMDVMMPVMDGPSACLRLAEIPATTTIPVILFTAKVQHSEQRDWEKFPIAGVIAKPFHPMELAGEVTSLLGW